MRAVAQQHPEPPLRGEALLSLLHGGILRLDRALERWLPTRLNPLAHTGALANAAFLIAGITGVLLLPWYSASVHSAYASVEAMEAAPWSAGLLRSLHRISSDLTILLAAIHGFRLFTDRRFGGARRWAWLTGVLLIGTLWLVGWLGYWLVWDQRAQSIALGTAKILDGLPIFADPLSRSFLANEGVNSLLFFVVFFLHMLIPLAMGILLWLHISHLSRSRFLPSRELWIWLLGSLILGSLIWPASSAPAADLLAPAERFTIDSFYLAPLWLFDRLSGTALWALGAGLGGALLLLPWLLSRGRAKAASVDTAKCNGCTHCYQDCPYDAIRMIPRADGRHWELQAEVDPARCVGCGICAGSCDSGGIALPQLPVLDQRKRIEEWVREETESGQDRLLAFVCVSSAGGGLVVDEASGSSPQLPAYRVFSVPCSGWLQRFTLERALRRGAAGILIVGCGGNEPHFREGADWTALRLSGEREPALRQDKVDTEKIHYLRLDASGEKALLREAAAFAQSCQAPAAAKVTAPVESASEGAAGGLRRKYLYGGRPAAALLAAIAIFALSTLSDLPYQPPQPQTLLVVSFKHPGQLQERCRNLSDEERAKQSLHMQREEICERRREDVRLAIEVNGERRLDKRFAPQGVHGDGNSVALERLALSPGEHVLRISLGSAGEGERWEHEEERTIQVGEGQRAVVIFDRVTGFRWHLPQAGPSKAAASAATSRGASYQRKHTGRWAGVKR